MRNKAPKETMGNFKMPKQSLKEALIRARGNSWFRPLGRNILKIPGAGRMLRGFMLKVMPRGHRIWVQIPTGPAEGM